MSNRKGYEIQQEPHDEEGQYPKDLQIVGIRGGLVGGQNGKCGGIAAEIK